MKNTWSSIRKLLSKFDQLYYESKGYADSLCDLMANLHFLSDKIDAEAMLVVVPDNSFHLYLRMMQRLGVISHVPIVIIGSSNQLSELLVKLSLSDKELRLVFARKLYFKFYAQLNESQFAQRFIII